jgi:hypothetical protein
MLVRGMHMVAGMLSNIAAREAATAPRSAPPFQLVSWQPGAHSRREDELARSRGNLDRTRPA